MYLETFNRWVPLLIKASKNNFYKYVTFSEGFFFLFCKIKVKNTLKSKLVKIHDVSVLTLLSVPIVILCSIWVPDPVPGAFWFFFLFLLLFRTQVSWLSRRPFRVMLVQRIFNALKGSLFHTGDHISKS